MAQMREAPLWSDPGVARIPGGPSTHDTVESQPRVGVMDRIRRRRLSAGILNVAHAPQSVENDRKRAAPPLRRDRLGEEFSMEPQIGGFEWSWSVRQVEEEGTGGSAVDTTEDDRDRASVGGLSVGA